jgi:hypothetical protein
MATPDYVVTAWRKSSFSAGNGSDCVEIGIAWRKSSFSGANDDNCVEVGPTAHAILVRDTKHRDSGTLAFPPATWNAFLSTR